MKHIIVKMFPNSNQGSPYKEEMVVLFSEHPKYPYKSRFDLGFLTVVLSEGYSVYIQPNDNIGQSAVHSFEVTQGPFTSPVRDHNHTHGTFNPGTASWEHDPAPWYERDPYVIPNQFPVIPPDDILSFRNHSSSEESSIRPGRKSDNVAEDGD